MCAFGITSCGDDGSTLLIDVKTDWIAGIEFATVETLVDDGSGVIVAADRAQDWLSGVRVAEIDGLSPGTRRVVVTLKSVTGATVAQRAVTVQLKGTLGVTVLLTRDCEDVSCAVGQSCLGGRCVAETCTPEMPASCPDPECSAASDCAAGGACSTARCEDTVCLYQGDDSMCSTGDYCAGESGCRPVPMREGGPDAGGVPDAGPITPVPPTGPTMAAGFHYTCAFGTTGNVVHCWGNDHYAQLGNGTGDAHSDAPTPVAGLPADVVALAGTSDDLGGTFGDPGATTCALTAAGEIWCWGRNDEGQAGGDAGGDVDQPRRVAGLGGPATHVTISNSHGCAVLQDGTAGCWGRGSGGQLGNGATPGRSTAVVVTGLSSARTVDAGREFTCALSDAGAGWCWGRNVRGQLGDGSRTDRSAPARISGLVEATAISAGDLHACAIHGAGAVSCWGENDLGQLGNGSAGDSNSPTPVNGLDDAMRLAVFGDTTCVVRSTGQVWCWGDNPLGVLGDDSDAARDVPQAISSPVTDFVDVTGGGWHACARRAGGQLVCWGDNSWGEVNGDATSNSDQWTPTALVGLP